MSTTNANPDESLLPAIAALDEAEKRLRDAAARAAAIGDYDNLTLITHWAKKLNALRAEANGLANGDVRPEAPPRRRSASAGVDRLGSRSSGTRATKAVRRAPIFTRDSDFLVKSARSRKSRGNYEHRAPAEVLFVVADCLSEWRSTKKLLVADQLLDAYAKRKGTPIPYQVYVALGWLVQIGLVRRHGRSGYSVPSPTTIIEDAHKAWAALGKG